jgi:hypothetical protein
LFGAGDRHQGGGLAEVCRLSLVAITLEGAELHMGPADVGADKLAYANSVAAHRSLDDAVGSLDRFDAVTRFPTGNRA